MDWNAKWDWESLVLYNPKSKTTEISKQQTTYWGIEEEDEMMGLGPFRLHEDKCNSVGSELAPGSSARSSVSVCTDSSFKEEIMKKPQVALGTITALSEYIGKKEDLLRPEHDDSPSVGSGESPIGLKLGKRMYFENIGCTKTAPLPELHVSSIGKKIKASNPKTPYCCQVEGCNLDLSSAKEYHRKHKVCADHSKCPKVVVGGLERRFCQQCSRFHSLSEFDEKKKSCRRRLADHNTRRRKPQLDLVQYNTLKMPFPLSAFTCTDGRRQMSLMPSHVHPIYSRSSSDPTWESSLSSKFSTTKGCLLKFGKPGGLDEQLQLAGIQFPRAVSLPGHSFNSLLSSKGTKPETLTRGFKESVLPTNLDPTPDFQQRALSLLSNNTWGSFPASNISLDHSINVNRLHHQPLTQGFTQNFLQTSSEFCQTDHLSTNGLTASANDTSHFELFKAPYENPVYSTPFN